MLFALSPAKTLDYDSAVPPEVAALATTPRYMSRAAELIAVLRAKSPKQVAALMELSDPLAALNVARYAAWSPRNTVRNSRPALLAFAGDVYGGLDAASLSHDELAWAQRHLAILSGLYGLLRPLDKLQPYRLEMGTALATSAGRDLYSYWGDAIARSIDTQLRGHTAPVLVNLASHEYFRAVDRRALKARVVDCVFEEGKLREDGNAGDWKVVSFFAKRARGLMARYAIRHRINAPEALRSFADAGYAYAAEVSTPDRLVFRRCLAA